MKATLVSIMILAGTSIWNQSDTTYRKALVDMDAYLELAQEVQAHRENHLISAETFVRMSRQDQVVILDTRSDEMYTKKHIKGAVHLNFSDFTQIELMRLFPDPETIILIYCNNNFEDDQIYFPTKSFNPRQFRRNARELTLALNIPTYINLYGYGYRNIYELDELISPFDNRIEFEGTEVGSVIEN